MDRQGRLYSCEYKARRVTRSERNGRIEVLVDKFEGKRFNAPNDIVVRRDGQSTSPIRCLLRSISASWIFTECFM